MIKSNKLNIKNLYVDPKKFFILFLAISFIISFIIGGIILGRA